MVRCDNSPLHLPGFWPHHWPPKRWEKPSGAAPAQLLPAKHSKALRAQCPRISARSTRRWSQAMSIPAACGTSPVCAQRHRALGRVRGCAEVCMTGWHSTAWPGLHKIQYFRKLRHLLLLWLWEALLLNHLQKPHFLLSGLKEVLQWHSQEGRRCVRSFHRAHV